MESNPNTVPPIASGEDAPTANSSPRPFPIGCLMTLVVLVLIPLIATITSNALWPMAMLFAGTLAVFCRKLNRPESVLLPGPSSLMGGCLGLATCAGLCTAFFGTCTLVADNSASEGALAGFPQPIFGSLRISMLSAFFATASLALSLLTYQIATRR